MIIRKDTAAVATTKPVVVDSIEARERKAKKIIINNRVVHQHLMIIAD
jgi:hypothetical protein